MTPTAEHSADAAEADDHHGPGGRFRNAAGRNAFARTASDTGSGDRLIPHVQVREGNRRRSRGTEVEAETARSGSADSHSSATAAGAVVSGSTDGAKIDIRKS